MTSVGILSERELEARFEVLNETYIKKLQIEARVLGDLATNHIIPTAIKFQNSLINNVLGLKELFGKDDYQELSSQQIAIIKKVSGYIQTLREDVNGIKEARKSINSIEDISDKAIAYANKIYPYMEKLRVSADKLEMLVDDELWPLPKYRELLFLR
jgi:glutamine synthetase